MSLSTAPPAREPTDPSSLNVVIISSSLVRRSILKNALARTDSVMVHCLDSFNQFVRYVDTSPQPADVLIVDVEEKCLGGLEVVDSFTNRYPNLTVMVTSDRSDAHFIMESMRAGAREVLSDPLSPVQLEQALNRAAVRKREIDSSKHEPGKVSIFTGAKGGVGVTTIASNFALALVKETGSQAALLDLDFRLGDSSLILGLSMQYSISDAILNEARLDSAFLDDLLTRHDSGLSVLAAPDHYLSHVSGTAVLKILKLLRQRFPHVVIDAGSKVPVLNDQILGMADSVYIVTEATVSGLRNTNRLVSYFKEFVDDQRLTIVLNRFDSRNNGFDDEAIAGAVMKAPEWRLPEDFVPIRRASNSGQPLLLQDCKVSRLLKDMARKASGKLDQAAPKRVFSLFGRN